MKKITLLPLLLGLLIAGCNRTETKKISSGTQANANDPTYDSQRSDLAKQQDASASAPTTPAPVTDQTPGLAQVAATPPALDAKTMADASAIASTTTPPSPTAPEAIVPVAPDAFNSTPIPPANLANIEAKSDISARLTEWKLNPDDIREELQTSGRIVRRKPAGAGEPTGPMDDILVTQINGKLTSDADTAGLKIEVRADKGVITLDGSAQSLAQVGKVIALSLDTAGVTQTISLVKVATTP